MVIAWHCCFIVYLDLGCSRTILIRVWGICITAVFRYLCLGFVFTYLVYKLCRVLYFYVIRVRVGFCVFVFKAIDLFVTLLWISFRVGLCGCPLWGLGNCRFGFVYVV